MILSKNISRRITNTKNGSLPFSLSEREIAQKPEKIHQKHEIEKEPVKIKCKKGVVEIKKEKVAWAGEDGSINVVGDLEHVKEQVETFAKAWREAKDP